MKHPQAGRDDSILTIANQPIYYSSEPVRRSPMPMTLKRITPIIVIWLASLLITSSAFAQKSVSGLLPVHAAALEQYLSANKDLTFRQEYNLDDEYLKSVHEWMGKTFKPNYAAGDFNRDRIKDFAVLLYRKGACVENDLAPEQHNRDCPLRLVVFNGLRKGFRVAYMDDLIGPPAAFIRFDKKLYYAVFESDADTFILSPAGKGYIMEFEKPL